MTFLLNTPGPFFARGGAAALNITEIFSTALYTGDGSTQSVTIGFPPDLVWVKLRSGSSSHYLNDTVRGAGNHLSANSTAEEEDFSGFDAFLSDGFRVGGISNTNAGTYASWSFRQEPRFFDIVTYTGDGVSGRTVSHNLGQQPGMLIVKRLDTTSPWSVWHKEISNTQRLVLNTGSNVSSGVWSSTTPTNTEFTVSNSSDVNASGGAYVAYLFGHDTDDAGRIQCGGYTGNGSTTGPIITLGWEPQWLLVKRVSGGGSASWHILDDKRNSSNPRNSVIFPDRTQQEITDNVFNTDFTSTGFQIKNTNAGFNSFGDPYTYMAIRAEGA